MLDTEQYSQEHFFIVKKQTVLLYPVICECCWPKAWIGIPALTLASFVALVK